MLLKLKTLLEIAESETDEDILLALLITKATNKVVNTRHPYGCDDTQKATAVLRYEDIILDVAVYLYSKKGAEGQTVHSETGVSRSYESAGIPQSYLADITPFVGRIK